MNEINITPDGNISVPIATSSLCHDVTGGLQGKLNSVINIITNSNTRVYIADIMSECGYINCVEGTTLPGEGTVVQLLKN